MFLQPGAEAGLTEWTAVLPTEQAMSAYAAVDALARELHRDTTTDKTLGQCRADAMCDLIGQRAQVATTITFAVPVRADTPAADEDVDRSGMPGDHGFAGTVGNDALDWVTDCDDLDPTDLNNLDGDAWDAALADLIARDPGRPPDPPPDHPWWDDLEATAHEMAEHHAAITTATDATAGGTGDYADDTHDPSRYGVAAHASCLPTALNRSMLGGAALDGSVLGGSALGDVDIDGVGMIPAAVIARMMRDLDISIVRALIDTETGTLRETSARAYRPSAAVRRFVITRDGHCRFPGCSHPARWCETDHVQPWPAGQTSADNLQLLCKHHHRTKHETAWKVTMTPDGTCTWTSPHGRTYVTHPETVTATHAATPVS